MKNVSKLNFFYFFGLMFFLSVIVSSFNKKDMMLDSSIIGTWRSESDSNYTINFTNNTCTWFYENIPTDVYIYTLSNSSPQCNQEIFVSENSKFLKLVNVNNSEEQICYEIYSLSETTLTLRELDKSGFLVFIRQ